MRRTRVLLVALATSTPSCSLVLPVESLSEGSLGSDASAGDAGVREESAPGADGKAPMDADAAEIDADLGTSCVVEITAGWSHTCARKQDGTVWCWGNNNAMQLGVSGGASSSTPMQIPGVSDVVALAAGDSHTCAVKRTGSVVCWGYDSVGQLGSGSATGTSPPIDVENLTRATRIAAGKDHTCALTTDGVVFCWGDNANGELGDDTTTPRAAPVQVQGLAGAVDVAVGWTHSCALTTDGTVSCWGDNANGELGDGTQSEHWTPTSPAASQNAPPQPRVSLAAGFHHTCAIEQDGTTWCWGMNTTGQLGDGTTTDRWLATAPRAEGKIVQLSMNGYTTIGPLSQTCGRTTGGTVFCWGANDFGEIGDGTTADRTSPTLVSALGPALAVGVGAKHACAIIGGGGVSCWGANDVGQLGDGTTNESHLPVAVAAICP